MIILFGYFNIMIDIEKLKPQIVEALMPLNPDKIILFAI
ncbi:hypothetical protein MNB_SV-15-601 [hydrothermal vent metagenome]|uniref:Uncharacterized protein n=1 Tax=hydrothermal vent metagenome TaxID=652676 RepID=A0A1W1EJR5_9ZZZZ